MDRLFIIGDSFTRWHKPYHHWVRYLTNHYEVHPYGKAGLTNDQIIHRLCRLPEYKPGDRLLMYFTEPGRLPLEFYGEINKTQRGVRITDFKNKTQYYTVMDISLNHSDRWVNNEREDEVNYIKLIKDQLYKQYDPLFLTWSTHFQEPLKDYVDLLEVSSLHDEGIVLDRITDIDNHPGPNGCYTIYKHIHEKLGVKDPLIEQQEEPSTVNKII